MKTKFVPNIIKKSHAGTRFCMFALSLCGLMGLFFTGQQIYPHMAAWFWKQQLSDAGAERVEVIMDQLAGLDDAGMAAIVESLGSDSEAVAGGAKHKLLILLESWKPLTEEERSQRLLNLAEMLAFQAELFGPSARRDASELAARILLCPFTSESPNRRSRLITACDEVFQSATSASGELSAPPVANAKLAQRSAKPGTAQNQWNSKNSVALQFDPLPGGGLPLVAEPVEDKKTKVILPGENREVPPSFFQEPSGTRMLDFSNRMNHPLQVPETTTQKTPPSSTGVPIQSMSLEESKVGENSTLQNFREWETLELMRQLGKAEENQAESLRAELRRRGLSQVEIDLAERLFDPDPAVRKRLVAELPGMAGIDASTWLIQCCKDEDAEVRLAAFSLLATSPNPLLLQKVKVLATNDSDARVQHLAEQIREGVKR
jgi:hypothetical protein